MTKAPPEILQNVFDRAFAGIGRARESFTPQFVPPEAGAIASISTGIAQVSGLPGVGFDERQEFPGGVFGIAFNVDEHEIGVVLLALPSTQRRSDRSTRPPSAKHFFRPLANFAN